MYLNEKSWEILQDEPYIVDSAIREFLDIYAAVKRKYPRKEIYVPEDELIYFRSTKYPLEKWMASADQEYKRLYEILYLIFDYPYKHYTFKYFEV